VNRNREKVRRERVGRFSGIGYKNTKRKKKGSLAKTIIFNQEKTITNKNEL
jgi:hypothetical protein